MGQVIAMPDEPRDTTRLLLPWYAAGTLDDQDRALVERHLSTCAACRADLAQERSLAAAIRADVPDASSGWEALRATLDRGDAVVGPLPPARASRDRSRWPAPLRALAAPRTMRWVAAAQFAALIVFGAMAALPTQRAGTYRALGDSAAARSGNTLVMFRPDASERSIRTALTATGARLVDGPTAAGAYLLDVPGGENGASLARLRANADVTMAEPVDEGQAE